MTEINPWIFLPKEFDAWFSRIILPKEKSKETKMNQDKRGRGRPKKDDSQKAYAHGVSFTDSQWSVLQKMAEDQKISISRLILKLAQIGALLSVVSCSGNSGYYPNGKIAEEINSVNISTYYAKSYRRRTKRRGPCLRALNTDSSTRFFLAPLADGLPCRLSDLSVMSKCGDEK